MASYAGRLPARSPLGGLVLESPDSSHATALRRSFERARTLEFEQQIQECVDLLQHPELVVAEVKGAYDAVAALLEAHALVQNAAASKEDAANSST